MVGDAPRTVEVGPKSMTANPYPLSSGVTYKTYWKGAGILFFEISL